MYRNFDVATRERHNSRGPTPSAAADYEGWKAGIQSQEKYLDSHFHGNDRKRDYAVGKVVLKYALRLTSGPNSGKGGQLQKTNIGPEFGLKKDFTGAKNTL